MSKDEELSLAKAMLPRGPSDEDVERLTGVSLADILGMRAEAASAPPSDAARRRAEATYSAARPAFRSVR